ncbi:hypothetical protein ACW5R3_02010 [Bizionia sp. KMM 8389]
MKSFFICALAILVFSCATDDEIQQTNRVVLLPVESAIVPNEVSIGETYEIIVTFKKPSDCYYYKDIYMRNDPDGTLVAVLASVLPDTYACQETNNIIEKTFILEPTRDITNYVFKFWHGNTNTGEDTYIIFEVPVID